MAVGVSCASGSGGRLKAAHGQQSKDRTMRPMRRQNITTASTPVARRSSGKRSTRVFISFSHCDELSLQRLRTMLAPAVRNTALDLWDDRRIGTGRGWRRAIEASLSRAHVAVLLVTSDFLASTFIASMELPAILLANRTRGLGIVWVPVGPSLFDQTPLAEIQAAIDPRRPLLRMSKSERDAAWVEVARKVLEVAKLARESNGKGGRRAAVHQGPRR